MAETPLYLLERVYLKDRTLGSIISPEGGLIAKTLELPWLENARGKSCIPEATYHVIYSKAVAKDNPDTPIDESGGRIYRPYPHYIVLDVKGRSGILIHRGTNPSHSLGCILVGGRLTDVATTTPSIADSAAKLTWMTDNLPKKFRLLVEEKNGKPYNIQ